MTQFLGDFSHYDDRITLDVAKRIRADGIVAVSHKVSEGVGGYDDEAAEAFTSFRAAGFDLIGAYAVTRTGDGRAQARTAIARADAIAPWWRSMPGWFWQVDLERWSYDPVSAQDGREMADEFATTGKAVVVYASKGQYGDQLMGWPYPLWNARYPSTRQAPYRDLYPGDTGSGWQTYSGQMPAFWQYASSATIGGLTTCDISAYRGTLDQLRALLTGSSTPTSTGGSTVSTAATEDIMNRLINGRRVADILGATDAMARTTVPALAEQVADLSAKLDAVLAAVKAIPAAGGGTPVEAGAMTITLTGTATPAA